MSRIAFVSACILLVGATAFAQQEKREGVVTTVLAQGDKHEGGPIEVRQIINGDENVNFLSMEMGARETVQGAPYTATAITENTQVLADGNRIAHKSTAFIARDGQGRVRREETFGPAGAETKKIVLITDPANKTDVVLNPDEQMARVVKRKEGANVIIMNQQKKVETDKKKVEFEARGFGIERHEETGQIKRETLPSQVIEGLTCDGERITRTIPAGAIGNEKPIEIVSETWTSPELHVMVMRKRSDPRSGETLYRLTDIKRGEPDPALFQVPSNFKSTIKVEPPPSRD